MPYTDNMPPSEERRERISSNNREEVMEGDAEQVARLAPARILVQLPADAKLTVDGAPTKSTSERREFITPSLEPGQTFFYTFRATTMRDGQPIMSEERVQVRAGEVTRVKMSFSARTLTRQ
jgi:uncharacterized protein (TIGR03000 family)